MRREWIRTGMLLGEEAMQRLEGARVALFGLGGVGSYAAEALVRSGVGAIDLFDHDRVSPSNLNRQLIATVESIGRPKVEVARERLLSINPQLQVRVHQTFYLPENASQWDLSVYDYIIDAIDTVSAKIELAVRAQQAGVPIISCMGTGNKLDPAQLELADLYETSVCPLARVMRRELSRRGVRSLQVLYSREKPRQPLCLAAEEGEAGSSRRQTPGSVPFVPSVAGLMLAGEVVRRLARIS